MSSHRIRTPDQRVRVFVSSTLGELSTERGVVRRAIENLHLAPVMFELGARPHPPRQLYRAYLAQSQIFIGIYWQRYGWVAPGEAISGLEDEFWLAGDLPRLLYIKEPAPDRESRLAELVAAFGADDRASYKRFSTLEELAELVENDLAVLLAERFDATSDSDGSSPPKQLLPAPTNPIIGREHEVSSLLEQVRGGARLVTLTGIGGIGKSRLAVEVARALSEEIPCVFIPLSAVHDGNRALRVIGDVIGARVDVGQSVLDVVVDQLHGQRVLLVLDNLEQIPDIGPVLAELLGAVPDLHILATSRQALRLRAEINVPVPPLRLPQPHPQLEQATDEPAVQLFLERARAVAAPWKLTTQTLHEIGEICTRLEGIPLAIELAASRTRLLAPADLLTRLDDRFSVLVGGGPDMPERQRTLRATIDWSFRLLTESEQTLLARLSVFDGGWTVDAADAVAGGGAADVLDGLGALLDGSVIQPADSAGPVPRFTTFETVRSYAAERLVEAGEYEATTARHLTYYCTLADLAQPFLCGPGQREWVARMDPERANLRLAVASGLKAGRYAAVVELIWDVIVLYFVRDAVDEPAGWLQAVADSAGTLDELTTAKLRSLHALTRVHRGDFTDVHADLEEPLAVFAREGMRFESAVALHQLGFVRYRVDGDVDGAIAALRESSALFDSLSHHWGVGLVEAMLGSILAAQGEFEQAEDCQRRSLERARLIDNEPQIVQALQHLAFIRLLGQRAAEAIPLLEEAAALEVAAILRTDATYGLDALAMIALSGGDGATASDAVAVASAERRTLGVAPWPSLEPIIAKNTEAIRRAIGAEAFAARERSADRRDLFETLKSTLVAVKSLESPRVTV